MALRFRSEIMVEGKTATYLVVPEKVVAKLGPKKRPPVRVTVAGHTFRTTVAAYSTGFFIPLNRENRTRAGVEAGETVTVSIEIDDEPRVVDVPDDFAQALRARRLRAGFDKLSYSHQREYVQWITSAKRADTRERRIAKATEMLAADQQSPMARWRHSSGVPHR
jgi:hypothetical protein